MAVVSAIDPRLRQRRIAIRRAQGRRRLRIVLAVLGISIAVAGGYALTQSPLLDLDEIGVAGVFGSEADAVRRAAELQTGTPMIELDLPAATHSVEALPWVRSAKVERNWPAGVTIEVIRRTPIAALPVGDGTSVLVDADGVAIERVDDVSVGLFTIAIAAVGELGDVQTQALPLLELVQIIPADLELWIETVGLRPGDGGLEIDLVGSAVVDLGDTRSLPEKLEALRAMLASVDLACVAEFDLRVADIPLAKRDAACEQGVSGAPSLP
jgi:cell division septal protein FtsQ